MASRASGVGRCCAVGVGADLAGGALWSIAVRIGAKLPTRALRCRAVGRRTYLSAWAGCWLYDRGGAALELTDIADRGARFAATWPTLIGDIEALKIEFASAASKK